MGRGRAGSHRASCWRALSGVALLTLAPAPARAGDLANATPGAGAAPVLSEHLVPESEWAADLVDALALDAALPDAAQPADTFSLLCAEHSEREVGAGGRNALVSERFEASAEVLPPRRPGDPARVVLDVPATALYAFSVEGVGLQRWVIDQQPVGHLDPTLLGVTWAAATVPLRAGPHEVSGYLGPGARAERVALVAQRSVCIAPADGWHAERPLTHGAKARTLVRAFGYERRLPPSGEPIEIEGEAYETVSAGGGRTNRRVAVAASQDMWATASQGPVELSYALHLAAPAVVTIDARVLGASPQLWSIDGRYRASVVPSGGPDVFTWEHVLTLPLGAGEHELRVRIPRKAGIDRMRATPRRSRDVDYLAVLRELGLPVSAAEAFVTRSDALANLSSSVFLELANGFQQRIEGDPSERAIVLVDPTPEVTSTSRPLSPLLPSEL